MPWSEEVGGKSGNYGNSSGKSYTSTVCIETLQRAQRSVGKLVKPQKLIIMKTEILKAVLCI